MTGDTPAPNRAQGGASPPVSARSTASKTVGQSRGSLFISHAAEDNDFALWLGARLSAAGYDVWADVLRLKGGDNWERVLEDALRNKASKMLWVATTHGVSKQGVRNEITIALATGKKIGDDNFIIPLKLEECEAPFQAVHIQWINFRKGWGAGLTELLENLGEIEGLTKTVGLNEDSMLRWLEAQRSRKAVLDRSTEVLMSNWLAVKQMPPSLRYFTFSGAGAEQQAAAAVGEYALPAVKHGSGFFGFGNSADYADTPHNIAPRLVQEIPLDDFLAEGVHDLGVLPREARNYYTVLVRTAFESALRQKGLAAFQFSGRTTGYWVQAGLIKGKERIAFDWKNGWKGSRNLTGDAKALRWHYGVSAHVRAEKEPYVQLTPRLIFTENDSLISSASKMHALRRSVPRAWRNDRWRDMLLAFLYWFSDGQEHFDVPVGTDRVIRFAAIPMTMQAPVSITSNTDGEEGEHIEEGDPVFEVGTDESDFDDGQEA